MEKLRFREGEEEVRIALFLSHTVLECTRGDYTWVLLTKRGSQSEASPALITHQSLMGTIVQRSMSTVPRDQRENASRAR